jgi:hypothetical protein
LASPFKSSQHFSLSAREATDVTAVVVLAVAVSSVVGHVRVQAATAVRVAVVIVHPDLLEIVRREVQATARLVHPGQSVIDHREVQATARLVHPGQSVIDLRVHHVRRDLLPGQRHRVPMSLLRLWRLPRPRRQPHHRQVHRRASRGDSKPCYWHRHVLSIANSIAVA